jgi:hypothetical protein
VLEELSDDALVAIEITMVQGSASALTQFAGATGTGCARGRMPLTSLVRRLAGEERALARVAPLHFSPCSRIGRGGLFIASLN